MMNRAANMLQNRIIKLFSGPVVGCIVSGIAIAANMQYAMAAVLGLGTFMVTWWLNAGYSLLPNAMQFCLLTIHKQVLIDFMA